MLFRSFETPVEWGMDLGSEHERWLCEQHFKKPTIVYQYPKKIKAFYMRETVGCAEGRQTVEAMDLLVPGIGELIGGSLREYRYDVLKSRMDTDGITDLDWYLELRKMPVETGGFGLGFERLVCYVSGVENIRDVIAFPRYHGHAET